MLNTLELIERIKTDFHSQLWNKLNVIKTCSITHINKFNLNIDKNFSKNFNKIYLSNNEITLQKLK